MTKYGLIGSSKYKKELDEVAAELRQMGHQVVAIPRDRHEHHHNHISQDNLNKKTITYQEFHNDLDKAEVALICNIDDYVGLNTCIDIGYAIKAGKTIEVLRPTLIPELLMLGAEKAE